MWCVYYFPRLVRGGRGEGWGSTGCYRSRRIARKRAQGLLKSRKRKIVRIVKS